MPYGQETDQAYSTAPTDHTGHVRYAAMLIPAHDK